MEPGRVTDGYEETFWAEQASCDLSPWLGLGAMNELIPTGLEFRCCLRNVLDLELHACLRLGNMRGPHVSAETRPSSFAEGPETQVFDTGEFLGEHIVVLAALECQAECSPIEGMTLSNIAHDGRDTCHELDLHSATSMTFPEATLYKVWDARADQVLQLPHRGSERRRPTTPDVASLTQNPIATLPGRKRATAGISQPVTTKKVKTAATAGAVLHGLTPARTSVGNLRQHSEQTRVAGTGERGQVRRRPAPAIPVVLRGVPSEVRNGSSSTCRSEQHVGGENRVDRDVVVMQRWVRSPPVSVFCSLSDSLGNRR